MNPVQCREGAWYNRTMAHDAAYAILDLVATAFWVAAASAVALTGFLRD